MQAGELKLEKAINRTESDTDTMKYETPILDSCRRLL